MTDKDLKRLNRSELLQLLLRLTEKNEELQHRLEQAEQALAEKRLKIDNAGSIAEAAMEMNQVFQSAQQAAEQYLENIRLLSERQEEICANRERESREKAEQMLADTRETCDSLVFQARQQAEQCWKEVQAKVGQLAETQAGLRELLAQSGLNKI